MTSFTSRRRTSSRSYGSADPIRSGRVPALRRRKKARQCRLHRRRASRFRRFRPIPCRLSWMFLWSTMILRSGLHFRSNRNRGKQRKSGGGSESRPCWPPLLVQDDTTQKRPRPSRARRDAVVVYGKWPRYKFTIWFRATSRPSCCHARPSSCRLNNLRITCVEYDVKEFINENSK